MTEVPSLSYYKAMTSTSLSSQYSPSLTITSPVNNIDWSELPIQKRCVDAYKKVVETAAITEKKEEEIVARLIRYTVVDPSPVLAEQSNADSIICQGVVMLNGQDDRGFLMEMAPNLAKKLETHNKRREEIEYEDKEGKLKKLKPIKVSNLDVIIEVMKEYK